MKNAVKLIHLEIFDGFNKFRGTFAIFYAKFIRFHGKYSNFCEVLSGNQSKTKSTQPLTFQNKCQKT